MSLASIPSGYPKSLSYNIKQLNSGFSRIGVKITPDRTTGIAPNDTSLFKLPPNSILDLKTFNVFFQLTTSSPGTSSGVYQPPRYSSSFIERLSVIINGQTIDIVSNYGLLFNCLMDLEGSSYDQISKRAPSCEYFDNSCRFTQATATDSSEVAIAGSNTLSATAPSSLDYAITQFLGFIGSTSTSCIDTGDLGDTYVSITWASPYVLGATAVSTSLTLAGGSYSLSNLYATVDVISFSSNDYYNMKAQKLAQNGLLVGFYSYNTMRFASVAKNTGVNVSFNITANSLDQCIATFVAEDSTSTWKRLIGYGSNDSGSTTYNAYQIISDPIGKVNNTGTVTTTAIGDLFYNTYYFKRNASDITGARWSINNRAINYGLIPAKEVWNQTMNALGYNLQDVGTNGVNFGILSIYHYLKYYFAHIIDLSCQSTDEFYLSGLNSLGSSVTVTYEATFATGNSQRVIPVVFARMSKVLQINSGKSILVI